MSRFVISCGGTGGHLAPGISIAEALIGRGHTCWLVISRKQVDARLIENYPGLNFVRAPGSPMSWRPLGFVYFIFQQIHLAAFAFRFLRGVQPHTVIAFGGFVSGGIAAAAILRRCPLVLHEANRIIGKATRILAGCATRVYLPDGVMLRRADPEKVRNFGYPIRRQIRKVSKEEAREGIGVGDTERLIVVVGGSQGAQVLNEWALNCFEEVAAEGVSIFCVTGLGKGDEGVRDCDGENGNRAKAYFTPFTDRMGEVLSSADVVVSRAGAGTIAELILCQAPSILIPYPHAAENHQIANARFLEEHGGCVVLEQKDIGKLTGRILDLILNDELLGELRRNLERLGDPNPSDLIVEDLEQIATKCKVRQIPRVSSHPSLKCCSNE